MTCMESLPVGRVLLGSFGVDSLTVGPSSKQSNGHESNHKGLVSWVVQFMRNKLNARHLTPRLVGSLTSSHSLDEFGFASLRLLALQIREQFLLLGDGTMVLVPCCDGVILVKHHTVLLLQTYVLKLE